MRIFAARHKDLSSDPQNLSVYKDRYGGGKMAQYIKVLAAKPEHLNSIPRTHMVERENQFLKVVL